MDFYEYQKNAKRTTADLGQPNDNLHMIMGISTESGELMDCFKKNLAYGKEIDWVNVQEEIGDMMWYIANFCTLNGFDFYRIIENNIEKLRTRYPEKFTEESANNRDLQAERKVLESISS